MNLYHHSRNWKLRFLRELVLQDRAKNKRNQLRTIDRQSMCPTESHLAIAHTLAFHTFLNPPSFSNCVAVYVQEAHPVPLRMPARDFNGYDLLCTQEYTWHTWLIAPVASPSIFVSALVWSSLHPLNRIWFVNKLNNGYILFTKRTTHNFPPTRLDRMTERSVRDILCMV